jgi:iron complex transport system permease protein
MKKNIILLIIVILLLFAGVIWGSHTLSVKNLFNSPIAELRFIRMVSAFFIGGSLGLSGLIFQSLLRNVLAEPFTLGISGGAGLGSALFFILGINSLTIYGLPFMSLFGALIALVIVLALSRRSNYSSENLLLSGVIVSTICSGVLMYLISISNVTELASISYYLLGDLQSINHKLLIFQAIYAVISIVIFQYFSPELNVISLGTDEAYYLGINTKKINLLLAICAAFLSASTVALVGIIGFVGLIIPHIVRRIFNCDHRKIILTVFLSGGIFLMLCDIISRIIFSAQEIPIGVITALVGGPIFLLILNRKRSF